MLRVQNLSYCYPGNKVPAIDNLTLEMAPGALYGLLGANGTGKSTLLYLMSGLLKPTQGTATLNDVETIKRLPETLRDIFIVPEEFDVPSVRLEEFVKLNAPFYPNFSYEQMNGYLEHFRLTPDIHLGQLSMGQRKKAFIAFALACNTRVLLMDEPTNGLDIPGKAEFRRAVVSAMNDERLIVVSTHQVRDLERVLDHVMIINNREVILNSSLRHIQEKLTFKYSADPADSQGALWISPAIGGNNIIRAREEGYAETDVNLETLFEFAYTNPVIVKAL